MPEYKVHFYTPTCRELISVLNGIMRYNNMIMAKDNRIIRQIKRLRLIFSRTSLTFAIMTVQKVKLRLESDLGEDFSLLLGYDTVTKY